MTGVKVAAALTPIVAHRGAPTATTVDNGGEFVRGAMDAWGAGKRMAELAAQRHRAWLDAES